MSDTELAAYVKTPKEVEMAERFTKSIEAKSSNVS